MEGGPSRREGRGNSKGERRGGGGNWNILAISKWKTFHKFGRPSDKESEEFAQKVRKGGGNILSTSCALLENIR